MVSPSVVTGACLFRACGKSMCRLPFCGTNDFYTTAISFRLMSDENSPMKKAVIVSWESLYKNVVWIVNLLVFKYIVKTMRNGIRVWSATLKSDSYLMLSQQNKIHCCTVMQYRCRPFNAARECLKSTLEGSISVFNIFSKYLKWL